MLCLLQGELMHTIVYTAHALAIVCSKPGFRNCSPLYVYVCHMYDCVNCVESTEFPEYTRGSKCGSDSSMVPVCEGSGPLLQLQHTHLYTQTGTYIVYACTYIGCACLFVCLLGMQGGWLWGFFLIFLLKP